MKDKLIDPLLPEGIHLNIASGPLQIIAALSALVFVLNFIFEVFVSYGTSYSHLVLVLCLNGVLGLWALIECFYVLSSQKWRSFRILTSLLFIQIVFPVLRYGFLALSPREVSADWLPSTQMHNSWHYIFLIPCSLIFMGVYRAIISLFTLNEKIRAANTEKQMLITLNALALARDNETGNHIIRTQHYVKNLALRLRKMGHYKKELDDQCIDLLFKASPLHDIGKVGIPDHILHKPGRLNDEEWEVMKTHALLGENILSSANIHTDSYQGVLKQGIDIAGGHHEKWDGTGYPRGLKGNEIPLSARIMALADVYDALVSKRVYKAGWSHEGAINEIISKSGIHFDPLLVDALIAEQHNFQYIAEKYRDL